MHSSILFEVALLKEKIPRSENIMLWNSYSKRLMLAVNSVSALFYANQRAFMEVPTNLKIEENSGNWHWSRCTLKTE